MNKMEAKLAADGFLEDDRLPAGTEVWNPDTRISYKVIRHLDTDDANHTYLVHDPQGKMYVLKEFFHKGARRRTDLSLDFTDAYFSDEITRAVKHSFITEPMKVMKVIVSTGGSDPFATDGRSIVPYVTVPLTDAFTCFDNHYFVTEYAEGQTLLDYMKSVGENSLPHLRWTLRIMEQLAEAVAYIHSAQAVHQGIAPQYITLTDEPDGSVQLKLTDFSLLSTFVRTNTGSIAPESINGYAGGVNGFSDSFFNGLVYHRNPQDLQMADIYSLGAVLYWMTLFDKANIRKPNMAYKLESEIKNIHSLRGSGYMPFAVDVDDPSETDMLEHLLNECYMLVTDATAYTVEDFSNRCRNAHEFLHRIREIQRIFP